MLLWCTYTFILSLLSDAGQGFPDGAPEDACWTMYPKHSGIFAQKAPCPFIISVQPQVYEPGNEISVTIAHPNGRTFRGLQIGAHRQTGNTEEIIGQFVKFPSKMKAVTCFGGNKDNMVTHLNNEEVDSVALTWRAPPYNAGNITFRATVVQNYDTFWHSAEADLITSNSDPSTIVPSNYTVVPTANLVRAIDFSKCGEIKGCFLYPRPCQGRDCIAAVTYQYRVATKDYLIEIFSDSALNYVSLGFSKDRQMGEDETYTCVSTSGRMSVQHGYNPAYHNERLLTMYVSEVEVRQVDGRLECRFVIPEVSQVQDLNHNSPTLDYDTKLYDHNTKWYLQLAWGETMPGTDVLTHHKEMPAQTSSLVRLRSASITYGSSYHPLVRAHAALMIISWMFLGGMVTVISRHYRDWRKEKLWCGTKIWFQVHRALATTILVLAALAILLIFAHYGPDIQQKSVPHSYVGLTVITAVGVQVMAGVLRPSPQHPARVYFNWAHRFLGHATHALAAVTMFLAFDLDYINSRMRRFGFTALSLWVILQLLWHLAYELVRCRKLTQENPETQAITENHKKTEEGDRHVKHLVATMETLMLAVYVGSLTVLCVVTLLAFLLY